MLRRRAVAVGVFVLGVVAAAAPLRGQSALNVPANGYGPHPAGTELALTRQKVISAALGEVGKVSDLGGKNGDKLGWQDLKAFFDEGSDWGPDCFKVPGVERGVKLAGHNPPGGEWCGIFGTWCFVQAGVQARWKFGVGPAPLQAHYDVKNVAPGDMGVIPRFLHHFVVVRRDGDQIWTVSGNSNHHAVALDSPRKVSSLCYYYRPCAEVLPSLARPTTVAHGMTPEESTIATHRV